MQTVPACPRRTCEGRSSSSRRHALSSKPRPVAGGAGVSYVRSRQRGRVNGRGKARVEKVRRG
jgi:hypothetical protein